MEEDQCRHSQCHSHGACLPPADGDADPVCTCDLGYTGEFCQATINGRLSVPLTVSVIVVIVGLMILAFVFAKIRQRQKRNKRKLASQQGSTTDQLNEDKYEICPT